MTNKAKQRYTARKMLDNESKRPRHQLAHKITAKARSVKGGFRLNLPAFLNLWKCKDGACKQLNK